MKNIAKTTRADLLRILKGRTFIVLSVLLVLFMVFIFFASDVCNIWKNTVDPNDLSTFEARVASSDYWQSLYLVFYSQFFVTVTGTVVLSSSFIREKIHKGLIRNQLMSGTSKSTLYLSYIISLAIATVLMLIISNLCILILALLTGCKLHASVTSILINEIVIAFSGVFASAVTVLISTVFKKAATAVILSALIVVGLVALPMKIVSVEISPEGEQFLDYIISDSPERLGDDIEMTFDGCEYRATYKINGEGHDWEIPSSMDKTKVFLCKTISKADPLAYTVHISILSFSIDTYVNSGLPLVTIISCIFWSTISALIGRALILKKDI